MGTRSKAQHAQIAGEQDRGLRRQQRRAVRLRRMDPIAPWLIFTRVARVLNRQHQRVAMLVDRTMLHA